MDEGRGTKATADEKSAHKGDGDVSVVRKGDVVKSKSRSKALVQTATPNIETLIGKAITKGNLDVVERLLAMRQELRAEAGKDAFFADLARFQALCPVIPKNITVKNKEEKGGGQRYKYATLDQIIRYVHETLNQCGFSYTIKGTQTEKTYKAIVEAHHVAGHTEVAEFEVPIDPKAYMSDPQKVGSAASFAKRYAFTNVFGIMTGDEDDDGVRVGAASENGGTVRDVTERRKPEAVPENATEQVDKMLDKMSWLPDATKEMYRKQAAKFIEKKDLKSLRGLAASLTKQYTLKKEEGGTK